MTTAARTAPAASSSSSDLRREVKRRVWICPGAGYSLLGRPLAAAWTYGTGAASAVVAIAAAWDPTPARLWATAALVVVSTLFWIAELFAAYAAWPVATTVAAATAGYRFAVAVLWGLIVVFAGVILASYQVSVFKGEGMSPLLHNDDRILLHLQVDEERLRPGGLVMFKLNSENKFTEAGQYMIGRILATPGQVLTVRDARYYVDGKIERQVALTDPYPIALSIARYPQQTIVPPGRYFIVQDAPDVALDSQVFSWARRDEIVSTRLFAWSGFPPLRSIE